MSDKSYQRVVMDVRDDQIAIIMPIRTATGELGYIESRVDRGLFFDETASVAMEFIRFSLLNAGSHAIHMREAEIHRTEPRDDNSDGVMIFRG